MVSLCLSMIVKNEEKIIERMLSSVAPILDSFCICDTGSTDDTKEVIKRFFKDKDIPGAVFEHPFQNFQYNRNVALQLSLKMNPTHILVMDADMVLEIGDGFDKTKDLSKADVLMIQQGTEHFFYKNARIFKASPSIRYIGFTHEYVSYPSESAVHTFDPKVLFIRDYGDGGSKSDKFERDQKLLESELEKNKTNERSWFYLANTYNNQGNKEKAIEAYTQRIGLGGWAQEIWYSYYQRGLARIHLHQDGEGIRDLLEAYQTDPNRIESLFHLIHYYRNHSKSHLAFLLYELVKKKAKDMSTYDGLFLENDIYLYRLEYEYTIFAFYVGQDQVYLPTLRVLHYCPHDSTVQNLLSNLKFYQHRLPPPLETKVLTRKMVKQWNQKTFIDCTTSSLSLIEFDESCYLVNCRIVNYFVDQKGKYHYDHDRIVTWNEAVFLDKKTLEISDTRPWEEPYLETKEERLINGMEDVRLFRSCKDETIRYLGTEWSPGGVSISLGSCDVDKGSLHQPVRLHYEKQGSVEKNWVHLPRLKEPKDLLVYKWYPLTVLEVDEGRATLWKEISSPAFLKHARGSSNGCLFQQEVWFVVHYVAYGDPRHYYHMILVLDEDTLECKRFTSLFKLSRFPIEYCLGLVVNDRHVLITYSEMDRTSNIAVYDKKLLEDTMFTLRDVLS